MASFVPPRRPLVLIPARRAATRLPDKPLALIHGEPMIVHVWRRALEADIGPVAVACDDPVVADAILAVGGTAVMTASDHPSGSDRIREAARRLDPEGQHDALVNLQGDLPTLDPTLPRRALVPLADPEVAIATLVAPITTEAERTSPHVVKAAVAFRDADDPEATGRALYFSRTAIPWGEGPLWHHIGLYAYRPWALDRFVALPPGVLEQRERLEQLRALEAGMRLDAARVDTVPLGVDTAEDLDRARALLG